MVTRTGYVEADVIVEGAMDESRTFTEFDDGTSQEFGGNLGSTLEKWLENLEAEAKRDGFVAEVYLLRHEHEMSEEECSCAQYETDHHPAYTFGTADDEA